MNSFCCLTSRNIQLVSPHVAASKFSFPIIIWPSYVMYLFDRIYASTNVAHLQATLMWFVWRENCHRHVSHTFWIIRLEKNIAEVTSNITFNVVWNYGGKFHLWIFWLIPLYLQLISRLKYEPKNGDREKFVPKCFLIEVRLSGVAIEVYFRIHPSNCLFYNTSVWVVTNFIPPTAEKEIVNR